MKDIFQLQNPWRETESYHFPFRPRSILSELCVQIDQPRMMGLVGSRQVGKSSLLFLLIKHLIERGVPKNAIFYFNLDNFQIRSLFEEIPSILEFTQHQSKEKVYLFLDEIQRLKTPGLWLKELHDLRLNFQIVYSGSSQVEIKSKLKEHLTGRVRQFEIPRLTYEEYLTFREPITRKEAFEEMLLFGSYPEVALAPNAQERRLLLRDIYQSYLQKDIVEFLQVENTTAFNHLLILLAHQTGQLLSIDPLASALKIKRHLVEHYLSILESTFVIKRIYPFFKNYKKEIAKTPKIYFLDLGLRNYLLSHFIELSLRNDVGHLFENFYYLELIGNDPYDHLRINFWRTTNQTEIDFIITREGHTEAVETKWKSKTAPKSFKTFKKYYPEISTRLVSSEQYLIAPFRQSK